MENELTQSVIDTKSWLNSLLQSMGIIIVLGIPVLAWGVYTNSAAAVITSRIDRQDRDISEWKTNQILIANQLVEVNKRLATISAQVTDVQDTVRRSFRRGVGK